MIFAALPEPSRLGDVLMAFLSILFEGAPYILVGTLLSGFIDAFLPATLLDRVLPKNKVLSTLAAGFLGLVFPVCECAVVPVVRRLVQKGLPMSCAMTYLLSAPIINPIVILSTLTAFNNFKAGQPNEFFDASNVSMTVARISLGYLIAAFIGLALIRRKPSDVLAPHIAVTVEKAGEGGVKPEDKRDFNVRLVHAMRTAMRDFLDTAVYFSIGVMITSVFNTQVDQTQIQALAGNDMVAVPSLMSLAFVLALCSTSDAFIAAPMATFSTGAKLAFLVLGPMLDVKLIFMYSSVFRRRFVVTLAIALFVLVGVLSVPWAAIVKSALAPLGLPPF